MPKKGYKQNKEHKRKISERMNGKDNPSWKGGKPKCIDCGSLRNTYERCNGICQKCWGKRNRGENHPNWKGGVSFEPYPIDWIDELKEAIRKRDDYVCQLCGIHQDESKRKLDVHHIDYNKDNLDPGNLISLCMSCHTKTNYNRDYWINYFVKQ